MDCKIKIYLDSLLPVGDDDGTEGWVLCVDLCVVHGPEAMEHEVFLVPSRRVLHLKVWLVPYDVVHKVQLRFGTGGQLEEGHFFPHKKYCKLCIPSNYFSYKSNLYILGDLCIIGGMCCSHTHGLMVREKFWQRNIWVVWSCVKKIIK